MPDFADILSFIQSASPMTVIAMLVVVIILLVRTKSTVNRVETNDLVHVSQELREIEEAVRSLHHPLARLEREMAIVRTLLHKRDAP